MTKWQQAVSNLLNLKPGTPKIYTPVPTTKKCKECGKEKDVFFFHKNSVKCKPCQLLYVAKWKRENKKWG